MGHAIWVSSAVLHWIFCFLLASPSTSCCCTSFSTQLNSRTIPSVTATEHEIETVTVIVIMGNNIRVSAADSMSSCQTAVAVIFFMYSSVMVTCEFKRSWQGVTTQAVSRICPMADLQLVNKLLAYSLDGAQRITVSLVSQRCSCRSRLLLPDVP